MKKLSDTYKELGIAFSFPIEIKDANGNKTYYEDSNGFCYRSEYDAKGNKTYHEDSDGYWCRFEYDANGNKTYFEDSDDYSCRFEYDADGNETYSEDSDDYWCRFEYDADGNETYHEDSDGYSCLFEYDADGNETYFENSNGLKRGTKRASCADKEDEDNAIIDWMKDEAQNASAVRDCPDSAGSQHVRLNITLDPEVARKAKVIAKESSRSFSGLIDLCLRRMITQVETQKGNSIK